MPDSLITDRLSSLPLLNKAALLRSWRELFRDDPPAGIRKELVLQLLAYRIQEQEFGALSDGSRLRLSEIVSATDARRSLSQRLTIKPGTRLVREWKQQIHVVNVEEGHYEYKGTRYVSLSEIARLITGTRWSGPRFFGMKNKPVKDPKKIP
jgi:hypothetical protein